VTLKISPLNLTVSLGDQYMFTGRAVQFIAQLTNNTVAPIAVSLTALGNIQPYSFDSDAGDIQSKLQVQVTDISESPSSRAKASLVNVPPLQSVTFPINGVFGAAEASGQVQLTTFTPVGPGRYVVSFTYQYTGPDQGLSNVFHGLLTSNAVVFYVH
jgi:hypothetical protein